MKVLTSYPVVQNGKNLTPNLYYDSADGEDFYDADGDYSEARGKKRKGLKSRKRKRTRVMPIKNSQANFTKKVMKALGDDKFFNADGSGMTSVEFGI